MRLISADKIKDAVSELCIEANIKLRPDVLSALKKAYRSEKKSRARDIISAIINNAQIAKRKSLAICQDTGYPAVFLEVGDGLCIKGDLRKAVNKGVEQGYKNGYLRSSIVPDPIKRGKPGYSPAIIHVEPVKGSRLKITVLPKGFGCENKTQLKMFNPTTNLKEIADFVVQAVNYAGPDACPPYVVGVGIGATADYACLLAKKALLRKLTVNGQRSTAKLERDLLKRINKLNIGPMGLGGKNTVLAVHINTHPTHISGLPVAVSISCHALRSAIRIL